MHELPPALILLLTVLAAGLLILQLEITSHILHARANRVIVHWSGHAAGRRIEDEPHADLVHMTNKEPDEDGEQEHDQHTRINNGNPTVHKKHKSTRTPQLHSRLACMRLVAGIQTNEYPSIDPRWRDAHDTTDDR
jgi:hypothetical protein